MKPAVRRSNLLASLTDRQSRSVVTLLAELCRHSAEARDWLCEDFARNQKTRANFLALVEKGDVREMNGGDGFAELAGEARSWHEEAQRMQSLMPRHAPRLYGGLTWVEMEELIGHYEAGAVDVGVFLLVRDWKKAGTAAGSSPRLLRAAAEFLNAVIRSGETRLALQLANAVTLLKRTKAKGPSAAFGYANWWKLHALLYMLRHPRESYRTRDVRAHLAALSLEISSLDFRRLCKRHGIRRDERAGRPRKRQSGG
ncbi:MAG: hypothetical protein Q8N18_18880 [Opitutaceae bacterium]|nr:hypothetical protein [Opitutaceae bacterium]